MITVDTKSAARRKRLQAAINRLVLKGATVAGLPRGKCAFCSSDIVPGDQYKGAGQLRAHTFCIDAVSGLLRETPAAVAR